MQKKVEFPFHSGQVVTVTMNGRYIDEAKIKKVKMGDDASYLLKIESLRYDPGMISYYILRSRREPLSNWWRKSVRYLGGKTVIENNASFSFETTPPSHSNRTTTAR